MTILPVLFGTLVASIAAQDAKTLVFPPNGNGTSLEMGSKIEPALQPDMTLAVPTTLVVPPSQQPQQPMLPSDYFFPSKDFFYFSFTLRRCRLITYPLCEAIIKLNVSRFGRRVSATKPRRHFGIGVCYSLSLFLSRTAYRREENNMHFQRNVCL